MVLEKLQTEIQAAPAKPKIIEEDFLGVEKVPSFSPKKEDLGVDLNDPANLEAMTFLEKYGYLKPPQDGSEWTLEYAMKKFQGMYRIEKTGIIDEASLEAMRLPRCGGPDF